jgi:hypothetical protein
MRVCAAGGVRMRLTVPNTCPSLPLYSRYRCLAARNYRSEPVLSRRDRPDSADPGRRRQSIHTYRSARRVADLFRVSRWRVRSDSARFTTSGWPVLMACWYQCRAWSKSPRRHSPTISALNSGVNARRCRRGFFSMPSMIGHPSGGEPLMMGVRQSKSSPVDVTGRTSRCQGGRSDA